MIALLAKIVL